jgi:hypothetical protein
MKAFPLKRFLLALFFALVLISCGSSSGGGIGGSGVTSQGSITGFGSIIVNGTEFDTTNATIIVEGVEIGVGDLIAQDNLDVGRVVTVYGTDGKSAVADRVVYNDNVEGPVESINVIDPATRKDIVVLGQTVIVNVVTEIKGTTFADLEVLALNNDVVEISGFVDDMGVIWATFLEKTGVFAPGLIVEVKGFVKNLDIIMRTFEINNLTVDYLSADTTGLPGGVPANDLFVEVEGTVDVVGGVMEATEIELEDDLDVEDSDEIEVTGFVTDIVSAFEFTVGNQVVRTDAGTVLVDWPAGGIALGDKVEAEGRLVGGILFAWEIEFWEPDQIEIEGLVTDDALAPGEFTVGTQVVQTDVDTVYEGITPGEIVLGVNLEVKGVWEDISRNILVADKVSFEED